ncbi:MAG: metallophosphoesterase [Gomphosphaeria aponina SAG 52.96 = DSM 107014]|uniref:Metallophosphoesterase n=1 Tax=Gomphosphaeria aponina SAG 52.96 = DSM 107014 TaxID=1521640 RepID=A0A941GNX8_9CHRO|nr:metallophosphoesterase [Gomphosphaeria aponina SAG 52.96 = DSM 107014]
MSFVCDPAIAVKIRRMKERVQWQHPLIVQQGIDQTRLVLSDDQPDNPNFSFLVLGDSGAGPHKNHHPQRQIAEMMLEHISTCHFLLHTGDVVYQVGSREFYQENFIKPYQELIEGGETTPYDQMVFKFPFLPVLGNHDYYDLPLLSRLLIQLTKPLGHFLGFQQILTLGTQGSDVGDVYSRAFLDYLKLKQGKDLHHHLESYYTAQTDTGKSLLYQPGKFTRLPNRYYTFSYGGIDFFALDSNTFNTPSPLPATQEGEAFRRSLEKRRLELEREEIQLRDRFSKLRDDLPDEAEQLDDIEGKLEQIEEIKLDINKQLQARGKTVIDSEQLEWLRDRLIESWHNDKVRGRIIYFHHPPYVTEATKWNQAQTLAVRQNIRWVLDQVSQALGSLPQGLPLVNLVFNGHAHCLEYLRTGNTGYADSHLNWIVCGGSGFSLRRQRLEGAELIDEQGNIAAVSQLFVGLNGHTTKKRRPYSFLRVDVQAGCPPKFIIHPFVAERFRHQWQEYQLEPFMISH